MAGSRTNAERLDALEDSLEGLIDALERGAEVEPAPPAPPAAQAPRHVPVFTNPARLPAHQYEAHPPAWWANPPPWMSAAQPRSESSEGMRVALEYLRLFLPLMRQGEDAKPERLLELFLSLQAASRPEPPAPDPETPSWQLALENPLVQAFVAQKLGIDEGLIKAFAQSELLEARGQEGADELASLLGTIVAAQASNADGGDDT